MPQVLDRVKKFCEEYETDLVFPFLRSVIIAEFGKENSDMYLLVAIKGKVVVGYTLILIEVWSGIRHAVVHQSQMDEGIPLPLEELEPWKPLLNAWTLEKKAKDLRCLAISPQMARLFSVFFKFKYKYTLLSHEVG